MDQKQRRKLYGKIFKYTFIFSVLSFLALYLSQATGYYNYSLHKKVVLTEEQIKQFEQDVADGKNLDIENYLEGTNKNYQNKTSQLGYNLSREISKYTKKGIEVAFKFLNQMVEEEES